MPVVIVARSMLLFATTRSLFDRVACYNHRAREYVRSFVSIGGSTKSSNVSPVEDYK